MGSNIRSELYSNMQNNGIARLEFMRRAFHSLPEMKAPHILDIGCGQGIPTLELANLSQGKIIGLDTNQEDLNLLSKKIAAAGLQHQVQVVNGSMFELNFPDECFDLIWSEGSINIIGFERGLREWRRLIKPRGYLVVHEMTWLRPNPPKRSWIASNPFIPEIGQQPNIHLRSLITVISSSITFHYQKIPGGVIIMAHLKREFPI